MIIIKCLSVNQNQQFYRKVHFFMFKKKVVSRFLKYVYRELFCHTWLFFYLTYLWISCSICCLQLNASDVEWSILSSSDICRFPTFSVGNLTRDSVRDALIRGITADQVQRGDFLYLIWYIISFYTSTFILFIGGKAPLGVLSIQYQYLYIYIYDSQWNVLIVIDKRSD